MLSVICFIFVNTGSLPIIFTLFQFSIKPVQLGHGKFTPYASNVVYDSLILSIMSKLNSDTSKTEKDRGKKTF